MRFGDGATGCFGRAPHLQSTSLIALFASCSWAAGRWRAHGKRLAALLAISALNFALASGFQASADDFQGLGTLGGTNSYAVSVSADGTAVVGYSFVAGDAAYHAFGWSGGTMSDLGTLGGTYSYAYGVSANGAVVVGTSQTTGNVTSQAFRWTAANGMQSIPNLLTASGVNIAGWSLTDARGASSDGSVIVGNGTNPSGNSEVWIARFSSQGSGLITTDVAARSFSGNAAMGQTGNAAISGSLGTMNEVATQTHNSQASRNTPFSVFGYSAYDSDPSYSGTFGISLDLPDAMMLGATLTASHIKTNMVYDGSSNMLGGSFGAFVARVPESYRLKLVTA